ncbi:uncharacterized protein LOC129725695 [Wyeomyia smithii]|uniref:uncharacterized protein LOC129725695 n=1 Tax=Wyeomyia smithii TaxID=174621 RepID=UPI002467B451|nr:uncharacterized protein LOC129725695 [Wyeomyia smithii]
MGRLSSLILLLAAFAGCQTAPATTTIIQPAQYYLLQPQPTTLKIQPHLIQPIQQLKLLPKQQQLIYYYPSIPLGSQIHDKPIQLITLKDEEETPWWQGFVNFFQPSTEKPAEAPESATEAPAETDSMKKQQMFMAPADAEQLPSKAGVQYNPQGHRYYILSGAPQFYGNFDALQNPLNPIFSLQPLQAIHARANSDIQALDDQQRLQPQIVTSIAPIAPVPAPVPAQLKNDLLESHPDKNHADRNWARSLDDEPNQEPEKQGLPQIQGRSQQDDEENGQNLPQADMDESKKEDREESRASHEPSVAAVKPTGLAIAGNGGLAAAAPTGTAISGKKGLALASPSATSVAGNFFGDDDDDKKN